MNTPHHPRSIEFWVAGVPAPQGSKTPFIDKRSGRAGMKESSKKLKPWRAAVVAAAEEAIAMAPDFVPYTGPVAVVASFFMPRPLKHYVAGDRSRELKADAPVWVTTTPDVDKVVRATFDALTTAGIWADDNLCARLTAAERYVTAETSSGVWLGLSPLPETR